MKTTRQKDHSTQTLTVRVPMTFRKHGGRKLVVVPAAQSDEDQRVARTTLEDSPLVCLLAHAFYWKQLLESGEYASMNELATAEHVDRSHLSKVLRLTMLAPELIDAILSGKEPEAISFEDLVGESHSNWQDQVEWLLRLMSENRRSPLA